MAHEQTYEEYRALIDFYERIYRIRFENLACGLVEYDGLLPGVSSSFLTRLFIENGRVAKLRNHGAADGYYIGTGTELTRYLRPQSMTLMGANGVYIGTFPAFDDVGNALDVVELRANEFCEPLINDINKTARMMAEIDAAIMTNISNCSASDILAVASEMEKKAINDAVRKRNVGAPAVAIIKPPKKDVTQDIDNTIATVIKGNATAYIADKLFDLQGAFETEQLKRLGVLSSNDYKRERVQSAEVTASASAVLDWAYIMIDTINNDAKLAGDETRARFNGTVEQFITPAGGENMPAEKESEENNA